MAPDEPDIPGLVQSDDASMSYPRAQGGDVPRARERAAWIQPDQGVAIGATSRDFDGVTASLAKGKHWPSLEKSAKFIPS